MVGVFGYFYWPLKFLKFKHINKIIKNRSSQIQKHHQHSLPQECKQTFQHIYLTSNSSYNLIHFNKFIMKVNRERNPYLKRVFSSQPHKYSYDQQTGKHLLINKKGESVSINKTGTYTPKFRPHFSGFVGHKDRYKIAELDPSALHFAPQDLYNQQNGYYTPQLDKLAGYAQYPYKITKNFPVHLCKPSVNRFVKQIERPKKAASMLLPAQIKKKQDKNSSLILQHSALKFSDPKQSQIYFDTAFNAMTLTKPLPKNKKKTCYNYKCKYMKNFVFDEKAKIKQSHRFVDTTQNTLGRSFYEKQLQMEMKETKLLSTMGLSTCVQN